MPRSPHRSAAYLRAKAELAAGVVVCWECKTRRATVPDHSPPLTAHVHVEGSGCCRLLPHCLTCSRAQGGRQAAVTRHETAEPAALQDPVGFPVEHPVWDVPWLERLLEVPANAPWPRLQTPPHPRALGSLGAEFAEAAAERMGQPLRWWQELAATRLLEVDAEGRLVWPAVLISTARQVGKSVLLRELLMWRLTQGSRFGGEPQTLLHVSRDVGVGRWIQREARTWARQFPGLFRVREANGLESIEYRPDGSMWLLKSKTSVYGHSSSLAVVDEGWGIAPDHIEDGVVPTLVERSSAQLLLCSTAHPQATALVLDRRRAALAALDEPGRADLLVEWSAPAGLELEDEAGWRMASPYWTPQREQAIRAALERALAAAAGKDAQDPRAGFQTQWLCRWPTGDAVAGKGEPLLPAGMWERARTSLHAAGAATIAVEDWFGEGAAVAAARRLATGELLLAAWAFPTRELAAERAAEVASYAPGSTLIVGATLVGDPWVHEVQAARVISATGSLTRAGLPLLREMVAAGQLLWDEADGRELADRLDATRVMPGPSGLRLVDGGRNDLVRAAVWVVATAAVPRPIPAIR